MERVFVPICIFNECRGGKLWLEYVLGRILNYLGVKPTDCRSIMKYVAVTGFDDKKKNLLKKNLTHLRKQKRRV